MNKQLATKIIDSQLRLIATQTVWNRTFGLYQIDASNQIVQRAVKIIRSVEKYTGNAPVILPEVA